MFNINKPMDSMGLPPETLEVMPNGIPSELLKYHQWVLWRWLQRPDGRWTKPPYQPNGRRASINDPATWTSFDEVFHSYKRGQGDGVGFVLTQNDPFCGIDLDKCLTKGSANPTPFAHIIMKYLNSYSEISPSGTGVRILIKATLPVGGRKAQALEMYDKRRFLTLTGHHLPGATTKITNRQQEILILHQFIFEGKGDQHTLNKPVFAPSNIRDNTLIEKASAAKNGERFANLWHGRWERYYPSQSEADLALCSLLAFWTGYDNGRIDRLFRISGLYREKWDISCTADGQTYGQKTIAKVMTGIHIGVSGNE